MTPTLGAWAAVAIGLLLTAPATAPANQTLAFPTAEGAGRFSLGGRGGAVLKVTTLDDAGPGSLRAAIEASGPRTVIFNVAGTIQLKKPLKISQGRITVAGQSAPGEGITIRDYPLVVAADDVVVQYIRSRLGDVSGVQDDAVSVTSGHRIILDHVSASWSVDETLSVSADYQKAQGPDAVTVQWCLIGESLNRSKHDKGAHGYGSLVRGGKGSKFSFHHNLWASHLARMPRPGNYADRAIDPVGAFIDFRNNVFYNWGGDASGYNADTISLSAYNFVGNTYVPGPNTKGRRAFKEQDPFAHAWFDGNAMDGKVPADPWSLVTGSDTPGYRLAKPVDMPPVITEPWNAAYRRVLAGAGATKVRDAVDARIIGGVQARTHAIINSQDDVGGWPALRGGFGSRDSDGDGIPDGWEEHNGLDAGDPRDGAAITRNGYSNLEIYLYTIAD